MEKQFTILPVTLRDNGSSPCALYFLTNVASSISVQCLEPPERSYTFCEGERSDGLGDT